MTKILIIEDEAAIRTNLADVLELEQFHPIAAANGKEGIELARKERPDLILCDILMPELDGPGVLEMLREDSGLAKTPFIFLTAKGERADLRKGMNMGADDYLIKPVPIEELLAAIRARLSRRRQQSEFKVEFKSAQPLESLGLSPREAEILLWVGQGKANSEIAIILEISAATVKKHLEHVFQKLGTENRTAAGLRALEVLNSQPASSS